MTRHTVAIVAGGLALTWGTGFVAGRASKRRPPAEVRTVETTKYATRVEYQDRVVTVAGKDRVIHRVVREVVTADGTKTRDVTTDDLTTERQATSSASEGVRATQVDRTTEVVIREAPRARWGLSAMTGVNASALAGAGRRWWGGATATHAFLGPLRWGVAVVKQQDAPTAIGVTVGVEW